MLSQALKKNQFSILCFSLLGLNSCTSLEPRFKTRNGEIENYLYVSADDFEAAKPLLRRSDIKGVQIIYSWASLEPTRNQYDFTKLDNDLNFIKSLNKELFIQLQDRTFSNRWKGVPRYIQNDPEYSGGTVKKEEGSGWIAAQWNSNVRARYQSLISALALKYDGKIRGINLPETATDLADNSTSAGFNCDKYFDAEIENARFAANAFKKSSVVLYSNFWPCEWANSKNYMQRTFDYAVKYQFGIGGPDVLPYKLGQMKNSYSFLNRYKGQLVLVAFAVQEPDLDYINPMTQNITTKDEQIAFARDYLGANIIFWAASSPWLKEGTEPSK